MKSETLLDVFKSRTLLLRALNLYFAWLVISMSFYGLSLNSRSLAGDPYLK